VLSVDIGYGIKPGLFGPRAPGIARTMVVKLIEIQHRSTIWSGRHQ
jgi:hypothetical protein